MTNNNNNNNQETNMTTSINSMNITFKVDYDDTKTYPHAVFSEIAKRMRNVFDEPFEGDAVVTHHWTMSGFEDITSFKDTVKSEAGASSYVHASQSFASLMRHWNGWSRWPDRNRNVPAQYQYLFSKDEDGNAAPRISSDTALRYVHNMLGDGFVAKVNQFILEQFALMVMEDMDGDYEDGIITSAPDEEGPEPF